MGGYNLAIVVSLVGLTIMKMLLLLFLLFGSPSLHLHFVACICICIFAACIYICTFEVCIYNCIFAACICIFAACICIFTACICICIFAVRPNPLKIASQQWQPRGPGERDPTSKQCGQVHISNINNSSAMWRNLFSRLMIEDKQFRWALEDSLTKPSMNLN